jgi:hypothetical protein
MMKEHLKLLHAVPQLLNPSLRQQYLIPRIRQVIRSVLHRYLPCFKLKATAYQQLMDTLLLERVTMAHPYLNRWDRLCGSI